MVIYFLLLLLVCLIYLILSKKTEERLKVLDERLDLFDFNWNQNIYNLVSLKKDQEIELDLFFTAMFGITRTHKLPIQLYWIEESEMERYSLIIEKLQIKEIPSLFFLNGKGEIVNANVSKFI